MKVTEGLLKTVVMVYGEKSGYKMLNTAHNIKQKTFN